MATMQKSWHKLQISLLLVFLFAWIGSSSCGGTLCSDCPQIQLQITAPDAIKKLIPSNASEEWGTLELSLASTSDEWIVGEVDKLKYNASTNRWSFSSEENDNRQTKVSLSATVKSDNKSVAEVHCMKVEIALTGGDLTKLTSGEGLKIRLLDKRQAYFLTKSVFLSLSGALVQKNSCKQSFISSQTTYFRSATSSKMLVIKGTDWQTCKKTEDSKAKTNRCLQLKE